MDNHVHRELLKYVEEDSTLTPEEKETTFRFAKRAKHLSGYTAEAGLARRLLAHPHVAIRGVTVPEDGARRDVAPEEFDGQGKIVGVRFSAPVGVLMIKSSPRNSTQHAPIVSERVLAAQEADG